MGRRAQLAESMAYPANPQDGYGWEKLYTEKLGEYYHKEHAIDMRIVRFHNIYGPLGTWQGGREKAPAAMCRKVAHAVIEGKDFVMASGFTQPVNLGRDEMVTINQLADIAMKAAGVKRKVHVDGPQGVRGRNSANPLSKKVMGGWAPEIDLETGTARTYRWIQEQAAVQAIR